MRAVEIMRSELARFGAASRLTPEAQRELATIAKRARKTGSNPRAEVSRALANMLKRNSADSV